MTNHNKTSSQSLFSCSPDLKLIEMLLLNLQRVAHKQTSANLNELKKHCKKGGPKF